MVDLVGNFEILFTRSSFFPNSFYKVSNSVPERRNWIKKGLTPLPVIIQGIVQYSDRLVGLGAVVSDY